MNSLFHKSLLWLVPLALVVAGCTRQTALVPPQIRYGLETCADCGMIINDPQFAAALAWRTSPDDPAKFATFDDIGCLLAWRNHHSSVQVAAIWVKDMRTDAWLNAPSALYVKSRQFSTPMGSGIAAGESKMDFPELPDRDRVLNWTNLLNAGEPEVIPSVSTNLEPSNH